MKSVYVINTYQILLLLYLLFILIVWSMTNMNIYIQNKQKKFQYSTNVATENTWNREYIRCSAFMYMNSMSVKNKENAKYTYDMMVNKIAASVASIYEQ